MALPLSALHHPCGVGDRTGTAVPPPAGPITPGPCKSFVEQLRSSWGVVVGGLMGLILPHSPALRRGQHEASIRHPGWVPRGSKCPSVLSGHPSRSLPGSGEQSPGLMPDIEKRIFFFNQVGKVSASGTDMPELSHFCVWKQAGKAGLNSAWSEAGLQQEPGACRYLPGCAEQQRWLGLEAALREKALHPARSSQAPKKQQAPVS